MRRKIIGFIGLALVILITNVDAASIGIGFRYWSSAWDISNQLIENPEDNAPSGVSVPAFTDPIDSVDVSGPGMFGGTLALTFTKKLSLSATVMTGNFDFSMKNTARYEFPQGSEYSYYETSYKSEQSAQRLDLDIAFQYKISNFFSAFIGYKQLSYSFDKQAVVRSSKWGYASGRPPSVFEGTTTIDAYSVGYQGPGVGLSGFYLVPGTNFIYFGTLGALPYLMSSGDVQTRLGDDDTGYAVNAELGFGYASPEFPLVPTIGYRYQMFSGFGDMEEVFNGFTVGLTYNFNL